MKLDLPQQGSAPSIFDLNLADISASLAPSPTPLNNAFVGMSPMVSTPQSTPQVPLLPPQPPLGQGPLQYSKPRTVLRQELGGGLQVESRFCRVMIPGQLLTASLKLELKNCRTDAPLRSVRANIRQGTEITGFNEIPTILPNQTIDVHLQVNFGASPNRQVRFEISTDRGKYPVTLECPVEDAVRPHLLSMQQFEDIQRQLLGLNATQTSFQIPPQVLGNEAGLLPQRIIETLHVAMINPSTPGASYMETGLICYAGIIPNGTGGGDRILLRINLNFTSGAGTIQAHCDSVFHCSTIMNSLKKALTIT